MHDKIKEYTRMLLFQLFALGKLHAVLVLSFKSDKSVQRLTALDPLPTIAEQRVELVLPSSVVDSLMPIIEYNDWNDAPEVFTKLIASLEKELSSKDGV